ncbi:MAG: ATP-binding protein [Coleofasciculus sp. D1-CHI-01]|uniref:ATP-binding protein n=1 Tax=Coleofasciculus sp. D1-CHI-01 TaxID=3068482 RepID=UPI0032FB9106
MAISSKHLSINAHGSGTMENHLLTLQVAIMQQIAQVTQGNGVPKDGLQTTVDQLRYGLQVDSCLIFMVSDLGLTTATLEGEVRGTKRQVDKYNVLRGKGTVDDSSSRLICEFYGKYYTWLIQGKPLIFPIADEQPPAPIQEWQRVSGLPLLILPLCHRQSYFGAISLLTTQAQRQWSQAEIDCVCAIASQWAMVFYYIQREQDYHIQQQKHQQVIAALNRAESRNNALLEIIPDALFRINSAGIYLDWHGAKTDTLPIPAADIIGKHLHQILPTPVAGLIWDHIEQALETKTIQRVEYQLWVNGKARNFEARIVASGVEEVSVIVQDVTDRVQMRLSLEQVNDALEMRVEERTAALRKVNDVLQVEIIERKRIEEQLRTSEEQLRQLTENIREVFFLTTPDFSQMIYISPVYQEVWGRSTKSLYEQPSSWLESIHPEDRDRVTQALHKQSLGEANFQEEYRIVRPDGSVRWMGVRAFPVVNEAGITIRIAGIAEDITERQRVQAELLNALAQEKELSDLKSRFITVTSHEFRTPLTTIHSSAELLEHYRHKWSDEKQLMHLHRIQTSVKYMTKLLNDVLILGKADAGKLALSLEPIDLEVFCATLVKELQLNLQKHSVINISYEWKATLDAQEIYLDKQLLQQILEDVLSNAIKYSSSEETIEVKLKGNREQITLEIRDRGIGIPLEDQDRLFEAFHRGTNVGTIPGTGLGLAIVKRCVDIHQGDIHINSTIGVGTTVTVTLPIVKS